MIVARAVETSVNGQPVMFVDVHHVVMRSRTGYAAAMSATPPTKLFRIQESFGRWFGLAVFGGMTLWTAFAMPSLDGPTVAIVRWALLTSLLALFTLSYLRRPPANALASRPVEIFLPLLVVAIPSFQAGAPQVIYDLTRNSDALASVVKVLFQPIGFSIGDIASLTSMALGEAFAVYSMLYLGRSFSIFAEARNLVTRGPYRYVRHPLYLGEMIAIWAYMLAYPTWWSMGLTMLFTVLQAWRAKVEERKLLQHFPEYATLRAQAGFLWPNVRRQSM
jgi:protein-S-isoprenylcysteine O-methyltransferase Ste14